MTTDNGCLILERMCLNNWHYIPEKVLTFSPEINFFTGHSGSGKSTIIDALQLVLYADSNGKNFFNKAAKEDSDRSLIEYLRGMKTVRENDEIGYLRNHNFSSTIVLEFSHSPGGQSFCVGVVFDVDVDGGGEINRLFFVHSGRLSEDRYRRDGRAATIAEVRAFLKSFPEEEVFYSSTNNRFRRELYERYFGGLNPDKFVALFKKAIPFRMDMKLEDFVGSYICMEKDIRIEEMQDSVTQYVRLNRRLQETEEEIELLEGVHGAYQKYLEAGEKTALCQYAQDAVEITALKEEIRQGIARTTAFREERDRAKEELASLEEEGRQMRDERDELVRRLENSGYLNVQESLRHVNETLERCRISRSSFDRMAEGLKGWKQMAGISHLIPAKIDQIASYGADERNLKEVREAIARVRRDLQEQRDENNDDLRRLQKEVRSLREQIAVLESGKKSYPSYLEEAKASLASALAERFGHPVPVEVLADLIEVKDETWVDAVEGFMGRNKLALIVPPEYAGAALEIYRRMDAGKYWQAAVIDTETVLADHRKRRRGSLAEEVECSVPYAEAYVDYLMGGLMKCRDVEELRASRSGITPECVLYQGYRLQHINPRSYGEWACIGRRSIDKKLEIARADLARKQSEIAPLRELKDFLEEKLAMESLSRDFDQILREQQDILSMPAREEEKRQLEKKLKELRGQNVEEWKARKDFLDEAMEANTTRRQSVGAAILDKENRIRSESQAVTDKEAELSEKEKEFTVQPEREEEYRKLLAKWEGNSFDRIRRLIASALNGAREQQDSCYDQLLAARGRHQSRFSFRELPVADRENGPYDSLLADLSEKRLPEFVEKSGELAKIAVDQFKNDFVYKIRSAIKDAMQQKDDMNRILARMDFGKDRYRFIVTKNRGADGRFYDLFMDEALDINPNQLTGRMENQLNLFTMEHENRYGDLIQELLEYFIPPEEAGERELEEARRNMEKYADYRTYLSFDMEQLVEGMAPARLSRMLSKNSGGEGQNPLYVALLASFAQVYRMNVKSGVRRRDTLRLVVLDEAFSQMDAEKVGSCIQLIRSLGFQAIISATNDKIQNYLENVNKTFVFANPDKNRIYIQEFEREGFRALLEEHGEDNQEESGE